MKASILTIGDEILLGQILDTNSRYLARELAQIGAETVEMRSVGDTRDAILGALTDLWKISDAIFVTGGLGPTKDDITKNTLAEFFNTTLEYNPQAYAWVQEIFAAEPERLTKNPYNQSQAVLPKTCVPLQNKKGTACGMWFEKDGKILVSLPGVPFETEYIFPTEVLPRLKAQFTDLNLRYKMVTVYQIPEAELAVKLEKFEAQLPKTFGLAYLPSPGFIRLRLTAKEHSENLDAQFALLKQFLKNLHFEETGETVVNYLTKQLAQSGVTVACAESCTGGNIAHLITSVAGASAYFLGGIVSYANEVKTGVLGVNAADLKQYGAVSEQVACQMAAGARKATGAQYAVSTTGIAGPDGGTREKPVGTVWIGVSGPKGTHAKKYLFSHTRERNIGRASVQALRDLLTEIYK